MYEGKREMQQKSYRLTRLLRFPIAGDISPSRFNPERLLHFEKHSEKFTIVARVNGTGKSYSLQCGSKVSDEHVASRTKDERERERVNIQGNDTEGHVVTCYSPPRAVVAGRTISPIVEDVVDVTKRLLDLQKGLT